MANRQYGVCFFGRYRWELNKVRFDPSGTDGRVTIKPGVGTLVFARTTERDEGIYQCLAENTAGVAVSYIVELKMACKS